MNKMGKFIHGNSNEQAYSNVSVGYFPKGIVPADPDPTPKITLEGHYGAISLGPTIFTLKEFLKKLGITVNDVAKALHGGETHEET